MRHVGTLIATLVIAPLAWILLAFGQERSIGAFADGQRAGGLHADDFLRPLVLLAAAGLLLGLAVTRWFSPLGALLTGVAYVSSYTVFLVAPNGLVDLFGYDVFVAGRQVDPLMPVRTGTTLFVGTLLLVGAASVGRWRRARPFDDGPGIALAPDRPLGADGLGLNPPRRSSESAMAAERLLGADGLGADRFRADGLGLNPPRRSYEPDMVVRYPTRPRSADTADDRSRWPTSQRNYSYEAPW